MGRSWEDGKQGKGSGQGWQTCGKESRSGQDHTKEDGKFGQQGQRQEAGGQGPGETGNPESCCIQGDGKGTCCKREDVRREGTGQDQVRNAEEGCCTSEGFQRHKVGRQACSKGCTQGDSDTGKASSEESNCRNHSGQARGERQESRSGEGSGSGGDQGGTGGCSRCA